MNVIQQYKMEGRYQAKRMYPIPDGALCSICDVALATDHHHQDGNTHNNNANNVMLLCHKCHLRLDRQAHRVGNRSKLTTEQIKMIKNPTRSMRNTAKECGITEAYANRIRRGLKNPKPIDTYEVATVPKGWEYQDRRGKPRALTIKQVKAILKPRPTLGSKMAKALANKYRVNLSTVFKARGRQGCYADSIYND